MPLCVTVPPLVDRALANGGIDTLRDIARRLSTVGGTATKENVETQGDWSKRATFEQLENAGLIEMQRGHGNLVNITMTEAGWALTGGKPLWM